MNSWLDLLYFDLYVEFDAGISTLSYLRQYTTTKALAGFLEFDNSCLEPFQYWHRSMKAASFVTSEFAASDPRDMVYSLLGIVNRMHPAGISTPIKRNYTLTIREVYTLLTSSLLISLPPLSILAQKRARRSNSKYATQLPSWVPDYNLGEQTGPLTYSAFFDASRALRQPHLFARSISDSVLTLAGVDFDHVIGSVPPLRDIYQNPAPLLELCEGLKPIYAPTGQTSIEALWRTCIGDAARISSGPEAWQCPAPPFLEENFRAYITALLYSDIFWESSEPNEIASRCLDVLDVLHEGFGDSRALPTRQEVRDGGTGELAQNTIQEALRFILDMSGFGIKRSIFRTERG